MSTTYEVRIERRAGRVLAEIVRETVTTPQSKRGSEWQKQTREIETVVIPVTDLPGLSEAVTSALLYALEEVPSYEEPRFMLHSMFKDEDPRPFWSWYEAKSFVRHARLRGKDTSQWMLRHLNGDIIEGYGQ